MFASEDEGNPYAGMVARGRSSYVPPQGQRPSPPATSEPPAPQSSSSSTVTAANAAAARRAEPGFVPALERRTSAILNFPPRVSSSVAESESHEPYSAAQPVNITPLLLRQMEQIIRTTSDASMANHINRYQAALASRRMKLISSTLRQMPHPAPSPRLLTALQSLCLLVRMCAYDAADADGAAMDRIRMGPGNDPLGPSQCWPVLLCQHFTSRLLFQAAYRRLWSAWRMYSPMELEHEDAVAEAKDREVDVQAMLQLLFAAQDVQEVEARLTAAVVAQHRHDMVAHYQRREMSPWRVYLRQLEPTKRIVRGAKTTLTEGQEEGEGDADVYRFRTLPTVYTYHDVPVVVKALCAAPEAATGVAADHSGSSAEAEVAAMTHAADFLQDVACRCLWCHPHIVGCLGAYTEKFVPSIAAAATERGDAGVVAPSDGEEDDEQQQHRQQKSETAETPESGLPWSHPPEVLSGTPVMALGYISELQIASDSFTTCWTLGEMLFPSSPSSPSSTTAAPRHYFTIPEALSICAQVADALQYILEDGGDVPAAVRTAWLTLDPSNVYVVRTTPGSEEGGKTHLPPPPPPRVPLLRDAGTAATRTAPSNAVRGGSSAFSDPPSLSASSNAVSAFATGLGVTPADEALVPEQSETAPLLQPTQLLRVHVDPAQESLFSSSSNGEERSPLVAHHTSAAAAARSSCSMSQTPTPTQTPSTAGRGAQQFVVRYCPPCDWTGRAVGSRWRPHPRATAPASYVVAQLLLALVTRQPPYAAYKRDSEVQRRVFASAAQRAKDAQAGVEVKLASRGQGYGIPASLPSSLAQWCRKALSLDRSQPPLELESLRDELTAIAASLPDMPTAAAAAAGSFAASSREMSARFDGAAA